MAIVSFEENRKIGGGRHARQSPIWKGGSLVIQGILKAQMAEGEEDIHERNYLEVPFTRVWGNSVEGYIS